MQKALGNHKLFIKSAECGKSEKTRENKKKREKIREKYAKYGCDSGCKELHIKLIYVLAISTRNNGVLTKEKMIKM